MSDSQKDEELNEDSQLICQDENPQSYNPEKIRFVGLITSARPIFSQISVRHKSKWLLESETWPKVMSNQSVFWKQLSTVQKQSSKLVFNNQIYTSKRNSVTENRQVRAQTLIFDQNFSFFHFV
jgi:hypothetical protein